MVTTGQRLSMTASLHDALSGEEVAQLLVQTITDHAIFFISPDGVVATWNEGAQHMLGYGAEEVLGQSAARFFTEEDRRDGLFERELRTAAVNGRATDENWLVRKDGSRFWASGATTPLRNEAGELRGFAKIFRDLTERKAAADTLREKEMRLRVALSAGRMGTWHWDIRANRQTLDESLHRLLGLSGGGAIAMTLRSFCKRSTPPTATWSTARSTAPSSRASTSTSTSASSGPTAPSTGSRTRATSSAPPTASRSS